SGEHVPRFLVAYVFAEKPGVDLESPFQVLEILLMNTSQAPKNVPSCFLFRFGREPRLESRCDLGPFHSGKEHRLENLRGGATVFGISHDTFERRYRCRVAAVRGQDLSKTLYRTNRIAEMIERNGTEAIPDRGAVVWVAIEPAFTELGKISPPLRP